MPTKSSHLGQQFPEASSLVVFRNEALNCGQHQNSFNTLVERFKAIFLYAIVRVCIPGWNSPHLCRQTNLLTPCRESRAGYPSLMLRHFPGMLKRWC